jgi:putative glutamine amidotransferase
MRPLIGLTTSVMALDWAGALTMPASVAWSSYTRAIVAAGGVPLLLTAEMGEIDEIMPVLDGLILPGGADIEPARYGESEIHPTVYGVNPARDRFEIALTRAVVARDLPLLAICRGLQVLNVALGGTLYQDVPTQHPGQREHGQGLAATEPWHEIRLAPGSCLALAYDDERVAANSFHHQAVRQLAPDLRAVGWAPDGVIEGVEHAASRFVVGVQWHPEVMFEADERHLRPFRVLIERAADYRRARRAPVVIGRQ